MKTLKAKRGHRLTLWLNEDDEKVLARRAAAAGMTRAAFVRQLIVDECSATAPSDVSGQGPTESRGDHGEGQGSVNPLKGSIVSQADLVSPPNEVRYVSARTLREMKRKAQARDHALPAGEERLLIRPAQLKGAAVIWPDVDLIDEPVAAKHRSDALGSLLDDFEAKHGQFTPEELARARKDLTPPPRKSRT